MKAERNVGLEQRRHQAKPITMWKVIRDEIREIDTSSKALRSFGVTVGGVLLLIGIAVLWQGNWQPGGLFYGLFAIGALLVLFGLALPRVLRPIHTAWMSLALVLGFIMTRIILTAVFYLVVTPIGLLLRLFGKDPLNRDLDSESETYWTPKVYHDPSPSRLEKYY